MTMKWSIIDGKPVSPLGEYGRADIWRHYMPLRVVPAIEAGLGTKFSFNAQAEACLRVKRHDETFTLDEVAALASTLYEHAFDMIANESRRMDRLQSRNQAPMNLDELRKIFRACMDVLKAQPQYTMIKR